jgi:phage terminase large subunit
LSFVKTPKQIEAFKLFGEDQLHTMLFGGSRSGKTMAIVRAIMIRASKEKSRHVSLRLNFNSAKTSLWMDTIPKCKQLCFPDLPLTRNKSDYVITFPNGSEYWIAGLDDDKRVEKILGKEFSTIHFNECSQLSYSAVQIALTRLAEKNDLKKKVYYDQNPPEKGHWSYYLFEKKLNPIDNTPIKNPKNYASMLMNPFDNLDNIDQEYIELLESLPDKEKDRFLYGKYTDNTGGQVYYSFDQDRHVMEVGRLPGSIYVGLDFNVMPMTAVIGQYINNTFHIIDEAFLENSNTYKMADYLIKKDYIGDLIPDSTGRNRKTSGNSDFEILKSKGFNILNVHNPTQWDRTNNVNRLFQENRLIISPKCKKLINDLEKTVWKDEKIYSGTDKMLGHISDALGYLTWKLEPFNGLRQSRSIIL